MWERSWLSSPARRPASSAAPPTTSIPPSPPEQANDPPQSKGRPTTKREDTVPTTYDASNARNLPRALANLSPKVRWDDGDGHMIEGKEAVAKHWTEQWQKADAKIEIERLAWQGSELRVAVRLDVRNADGSR